MTRIRILLADTTAQVREAVCAALHGVPDLQVVGESSGEVELLLRASGADVVIMPVSGHALPAVAERLVDEYPRIGVLGVDPGFRHGVLYQLRPHLEPIDPVTADCLVAAVRRAAGFDLQPAEVPAPPTVLGEGS